jgi:tetratricopeptide (TPR) repeat protein
VFIAYNLIYGLKAGVDNAAHVGGVIAGLALGAVIPSMLLDAVRDSAGTDVGSVAASNLPPPALGASSEAQARFKLVAAATVVVLGLGAYATARYSIPKMRAVRTEMLSAFENDTSELIPVLQGRIQKNPQDSAGLALLGEEYLFADDPRSAVAPLQKALALDPRSASTHHNLAIADLGVGDFQGAESEIIKAAGQDDPGAHELIQGLAEDGLGHPDAALDHFKKVVPSPSATYVDMLDLAQAHANLELGRAEDARAIYAKMLARRATDTRALAGMAALKPAANTPAGKLDPPPVPIIFNRLMDLPATWPYLP